MDKLNMKINRILIGLSIIIGCQTCLFIGVFIPIIHKGFAELCIGIPLLIWYLVLILLTLFSLPRIKFVSLNKKLLLGFLAVSCSVLFILFESLHFPSM